ncbi:transposase [Clostridium sp. LP20]|uniref:transposase n=1 Tax=Clostridium sp. LP20 TaxID=3418665 RepID=UPI003EE77FB8
MVINDTNYDNLNKFLGNLLGKELYISKKINTCPHCKSKSIIKYGNYKNGQRYKCKDCYKTFSKRTNTPWYYSKKSPYMWAKFIENMLKIDTLRNSAAKLKIDLTTAFYWRHKVLYALASLLDPIKLAESVEMGKLLVKENFKGDKGAQFKEKKFIWVIVASDNKEQVLAKAISKDVWNKRSFEENIYSRIDENSYLRTYGDRFLKAIEIKHNKEKTKEDYTMDKFLKEYVGELYSAMLSFHGVATKYLQHYMYWITIFCVEKKHDLFSLLYKLARKNSYICGRDLSNIKAI